MRKLIIILASVLVTFLVVLIALNISIGDKQVDHKIPRLYSVNDKQFTRAMGFVLGHPLLEGNSVQELINGDEIFPEMLAAIRSANSSITFETYIFFSGEIGAQFVDALLDKAKKGVKVHLLLDWVGGQLDGRLLAIMEDNGVLIQWYNTPNWTNLHRLNHRTHRKLLVIDGKTGFTGGVGIADVWRGDARNSSQWRDTHFKVQGPVVLQMQAAFIDNWMQASGEVLHGIKYLPEVPEIGTVRAHMFTSSAGGGAESMQLMYLLSINSAKDTIRISASYFVPDNVAVKTMVAALRRGVKIQLVLPGSDLDRQIVRHASRARWGPLLKAGAEIYEYQTTMYHVKMMIVDTLWVSVGSTNFDARSFAINDEANLNVYDKNFASKQTDMFFEDLAASRRISLDEWTNRPWHQKSLDALASLIGSQL